MAKKRFYPSIRDRSKAPSGMEKEMVKEYGSSSRSQAMHMKKKDGGMIHEDWAAPCLTPRSVIEKEWPGYGYIMGEQMKDLFSGVNDMMKKDRKETNSIKDPRKY